MLVDRSVRDAVSYMCKVSSGGRLLVEQCQQMLNGLLIVFGLVDNEQKALSK